MFNKQLKENIKKVDKEIGRLMDEWINETNPMIKQERKEQIDKLTEVRVKLSECKVSEAIVKEVLSGVVGIGSLLVVLKHEKYDVITSKAFGMIGKAFRG